MASHVNEQRPERHLPAKGVLNKRLLQFYGPRSQGDEKGQCGREKYWLLKVALQIYLSFADILGFINLCILAVEGNFQLLFFQMFFCLTFFS